MRVLVPAAAGVLLIGVAILMGILINRASKQDLPAAETGGSALSEQSTSAAAESDTTAVTEQSTTAAAEPSTAETEKQTEEPSSETETETAEETTAKPDAAPTLTLLGEAEMTLPAGTPYGEPGYTAADAEDGDLTGNVSAENLPDVNVPGDYSVTYRVTDSAGQEASAVRVVHVADMTPPELILGGGAEVQIPLGTQWVDPGYLAQDNVEGDITSRVTIDTDLNTAAEGSYTIHYHIADSRGNEAGAARTVIVYRPQETAPANPGEKIVYLTFDDGPGPYTAQLLDILDQYGVKATFFVTAQFPENIPLIAEEARRGHTVAVHSLHHRYGEIYTSEDAFWADFNAMNDIIEQQTGSRTNILRFPGGASNEGSREYCEGIMSRLTASAAERGIVWFDWNVSAGDTGANQDPESVAAAVIAGIQKYPVSVVLQHDIQPHSVNAMPAILSWGQANGYTFLPITSSTTPVHGTVLN